MKSKSFICLTNIWLTNTSGESKKQPQGLTFRWYLQHLKFILIVGFLVLFTGCSKKQDLVYKEVLTPIRCQAKMPVKPVNDGSFEAHKNKMVYYLRCESTLKYCLGLTSLKGD